MIYTNFNPASQEDSIVRLEQDIIGCILNNGVLFSEVASFLKPEHFTKKYHRSIYETMITLSEAETPLNWETVHDALHKNDSKIKIPLKYFSDLMTGAVQESAIKWNAQKLIRYSQAKEMKEIAGKAQKLLDDPANAAEAATLMQSAVDIVAGEKEKDVYTAIDKMPQIITELDKINRGIIEPGLKSHIDDLNALVRFKPGQLTVIAGRPGEGKTSLLFNIAEHVAFHQSQQVLFFSLEMTADELFTRQLLSRAKVPGDRFLENVTISPSSWTDIVSAKDYIEQRGAGLHLCDRAGLSSIQIRSIAKQMNQTSRLGLIAIDYLTLISPDRIRPSSTREQEVASIIRSLKIISKDLMVPVLVCSQLNREIDKGEKRREPRLSDLRDSGSIEQDADIVIFIHHPEENGTTATIKVAKNRHGRTGKIDAAWMPQFARFEGLEQRHGDI